MKADRSPLLINGDRCDASALLSQVYATDYKAWQQNRGDLSDVSFSWSADTAASMIQIGEEGQRLMDLRHGSGFPDFTFNPEAPGSIRNLAYNNGLHVRQFAEAAESLGAYLGRPLVERQAYYPGAKRHDGVQTTVIEGLHRTGDDERESALEMLEAMRSEGVDVAAAEIASFLIQATQLITDQDDRILGQHGAVMLDDYYPSEATMFAARIGAASDLAHLFSIKSGYNAHMLFLQREGYNPDPTTQLTEGELAWLQEYLVNQHEFRVNYQYSLTEAEILFGKLRGPVTEYFGYVAIESQKGNITSLRQVFDLDAQFEADPAQFLESARLFI